MQSSSSGQKVANRVSSFLHRQLSFTLPSSSRKETASRENGITSSRAPVRNSDSSDRRPTKKTPSESTTDDGSKLKARNMLHGKKQEHPRLSFDRCNPSLKVYSGSRPEDIPIQFPVLPQRPSKSATADLPIMCLTSGPDPRVLHLIRSQIQRSSSPVDKVVPSSKMNDAVSSTRLSGCRPDRENKNQVDEDLSFIDGCEEDGEVECSNNNMLFYDCSQVAAGCHCSSDCCSFAVSESLYEFLSPKADCRAGDPVADSYCVLRTESFVLMSIADGVNWGEGAAAASRSAVAASISHLYHSLCTLSLVGGATTRDIFVSLLRSFTSAQEAILNDPVAHLTTLTSAVLLPVSESSSVLCTCTVGDSLAFVFRKDTKSVVREVTEASHDISSVRDMRNALGALGGVSDGRRPELGNLSISLATGLQKGDIVFLTTDGVSDNFDPVVGRIATSTTSPSKQQTVNSRSGKQRMSPQERHAASLQQMAQVIATDELLERDSITTESLTRSLISFVVQLTQQKRSILSEALPTFRIESKDGDDEDEESYSSQKERRKRVAHLLCRAPGKMDHATVAAAVVALKSWPASGSKEHGPRKGLRGRLASFDDCSL